MLYDERLPARFWDKVEACPMSGCWHWMAAHNGHGYGKFYWSSLNPKNKSLAHRVAYTELVGPIPEGLHTDHLCSNRGCVNPAHLEPVTHRENVRRGDVVKARKARAAAMTTCKHGHPWVEENIYTYPSGQRDCRTCRRARKARYRAKKNNSTHAAA